MEKTIEIHYLEALNGLLSGNLVALDCSFYKERKFYSLLMKELYPTGMRRYFKTVIPASHVSRMRSLLTYIHEYGNA